MGEGLGFKYLTLLMEKQKEKHTGNLDYIVIYKVRL